MKQNVVNKKFAKGFTLLELLVVVLIIGILAGIALPQYKLVVLKSRTVQAMSFADEVWKSQQIYYLNHGTYAEEFSGLDISLPNAQTSVVSYPWGTCHIFQGQSIYCAIKINGEIKIQFSRLFRGQERGCRAHTGNKENTVQEKVCISLGGKFQKENTNEGYVQYLL